MNKNRKIDLVRNYRNILKDYPYAFLVGNLGLNVNETRDIRQKLHAIDSKFFVIKNNLMQIAIADTQLSDLKNLLKGPIGMVASVDPIASSRLLLTFLKNSEMPLKLVGGYVNGRIILEKEINLLSQYLDKTQVNIKILNILKTSTQKFSFLLKESSVRLLKIIKNKLNTGELNDCK